MSNDSIVVGLYQYKSKVNHYLSLPEQLVGGTMSSCAALLELFMGKLDVYSSNEVLLVNQKIDFTHLKYQPVISHRLDDFNVLLGVNDITDNQTNSAINRFLVKDRSNDRVYKHVLNEMTQYFISSEKSSVEGFVHLYRALELVSYSFPMVFSSSATGYLGSYKELRAYFTNKETGELKFYRHFLDALFDSDPAYNYQFDIAINSDYTQELVKVLKNTINVDEVTFGESILQIKFKDMLSMIIDIRNRYFHMLTGDARDNFFGVDYSINDLFSSINPYIVNWYAYVFVKIITQRIQREC